ncbi:MAG: (2Fe-2S)-binding protein [Acidobacteria bacterium]|nr:MAG: (2Fe-2S)-binding protein [Acidobacteriota bacterium]
MSFDALKSAFAELRRKQIQEFSGEKALICTCFGVSEETIESVVKEMAAETIEQVIEACRAGSGCGSCRPLIQEIIDQSKLPY